jgi:hypothetical protein
MASADAVTLLDVMQAVREEAANEQETLAAMVHLLTSGQIRLSDEATTWGEMAEALLIMGIMTLLLLV